MQQRTRQSCVKPGIYTQHHPERYPEEARLLVLAAYAENELAAPQREQMEAHLRDCAACRKFLEELSEANPVEIAVARCPSSESLDTFLFSRSALPDEQTLKIEKHLQHCSLCREECEWLRQLEDPAVAYQAPAATVARTHFAPILAMAAMLAAAFAAFLFWQSQYPDLPNEQLQRLAVIKEPSEIDFVQLERTAKQLNEELRRPYESGVHLFKQGKFEEASRLFEQVRAGSPDHSAALFLLGYSYYKMNQPEKAFSLCEQAENIKPHSYERCMFLVHIALKTGNFERARLEITALHHSEPQHPEIRRMYEQITALMPARRKT